ncbi:MAG: SGNH/GDSL hydrolase family protein [Pseudarthrobacter sp.]|nr:SGNH/GDSL hydrolase family protein [Pseudarthrobacter sp.]
MIPGFPVGGVVDGSSNRALAGMAVGAAMLLCVVTACIPAGAQEQASVDSIRVVVIGDSLSTGFGTSADEAWPVLLKSVLLLNDRAMQVTNAAENGSGYLVTGERGDTFGDEVQAAVGPNTDVVVFFGSDNDEGTDPEALRAAAASTFAAASAIAPKAVLVAVGPLSGNDLPLPELAGVRDSTAAAAQDTGVPFIDPIADQWLAGRVDVLLGPDREHPSVAGQELLRDKMRAILSSAVQG